MPAPRRIFLLSPASCAGERAQLLFNDRARFELARRIRTRRGVPLGEVFSFLSGLFFRGKLRYAREFAMSGGGLRSLSRHGALIITTDRGLVSVDRRVTIDDLRAMACGDIDARDERYRAELSRDAAKLARELDPPDQVILLGSIATGKYADILVEALGERLQFPQEFVGRGDMSRGGLMLRCADEGRSLTHVPLAGAIRRGARPPRLEPRRRSSNIIPIVVAGDEAGL